MADQPTSPLDDAPEEIKLAVDLIYLLESNEIDPEVALNALKIVQNDLENKLKAKDLELKELKDFLNKFHFLLINTVMTA